jgi:hypothetical protein
MAIVQIMGVGRVITLSSVLGFSDVSEEGTASIFRVTAIHEGAEVTERIKYVGYIGRFEEMPFLYNRNIFFFPITSVVI